MTVREDAQADVGNVFSEAKRVRKELGMDADPDVVVIDARANKPSASKL